MLHGSITVSNYAWTMLFEDKEYPRFIKACTPQKPADQPKACHTCMSSKQPIVASSATTWQARFERAHLSRS